MDKGLLLYYIIPFCGLLWVLAAVLKLLFYKITYKATKAVCVRSHLIVTDVKNDGQIHTEVSYMPVWEYCFDEIRYTSSMKKVTVRKDVPVGTEKTIYVNPKKPEIIVVADKNYYGDYVVILVISLIIALIISGVALLLYKVFICA